MIEVNGHLFRILRPGDADFIVEQYPHLMHFEILDKLKDRGVSISKSTLLRFARVLNLEKTEECNRRTREYCTAYRQKSVEEWQKNNREKFREIYTRNFGKCKKPHRGFTDEQRARGHAALSRMIRMERTRIALGLPQLTKRRFSFKAKGYGGARYLLRKNGYETTKGDEVYYTSDTKRKKRAEKKYAEKFNMIFIEK